MEILVVGSEVLFGGIGRLVEGAAYRIGHASSRAWCSRSSRSRRW